MPAQVSAVHLTGEAIAAFSCFTPQLETAVLLLLASGSISVFECRTHAPLNRLRSGKRSSPQPMRIEICWGCSISLTESLCASLFNPPLFFCSCCRLRVLRAIPRAAAAGAYFVSPRQPAKSDLGVVCCQNPTLCRCCC